MTLSTIFSTSAPLPTLILPKPYSLDHVTEDLTQQKLRVQRSINKNAKGQKYLPGGALQSRKVLNYLPRLDPPPLRIPEQQNPYVQDFGT